MLRFTVIFSGVLLLTACSGDRWVRDKVIEDSDIQVSLEHRKKNDTVAEQYYAHPVAMNHRLIAYILKGITYEDPRLFQEPTPMPVFFNYEIIRLAPALSDALVHADSNQRIRFLSYNMGGGLIFAARQKNEGVLFIRPENKLNIAFNFINEEIQPGDDYEETSYRAQRDPQKITASSTPLKPNDWYTLYRSEEDGKEYPLWAVVDLEKLDKLARTLELEQEEKTAVIEPGETPDQERIKERLEFLKELHDGGLIDEKEYEAKKKEILGEIK